MKSNKSFVSIFILVLILFGFSGLLSANEIQNHQTLFYDVIDGEAWSPPEDPTIVRAKRVYVNYELLVSDPQRLPTAHSDTTESMVLNLFDDVVLTAVLDRLDSTIPEFFSWIGHIEGIRQSNVTLVIGEGMVQGNVTVPGAVYQISHLGNGIHAIYEIDQTAFPNELDPIPIDSPERTIAFDAISADDGSVIDVIVFFTGAARVAAGGSDNIIAQIIKAGQDTNIGYSSSGVIQSINLIDPYAYNAEVSYDETNFDWTQALTRLRQNGDGYMDEVHTLRDRYNADIVVLVVDNQSSCGASYSMQTLSTSFASYSFSLVSRNCAINNYSLAHELGHVMGSQHNRENASNNGVYSYSYGYQDPDGFFRTLMAYDCPGGCIRLNYWSNPDVQYNGQPLGIDEGDPMAADNRKSLNNTRYTVANFRISTGSLTVTLAPSTAVNAGARWRVDGGEWHTSGFTQANLTADSHTVTFLSIDDWTAPSSQTVRVTSNQTMTTTGTYAPQPGSLQVTLAPSAAANAGARWRVDGGEWHTSGFTQTNLAAGSHTVTFLSVDDWTAPSSQTVTIASNQTMTANGTYTPAPGSLQVSLSPTGAVSAGARWRVDGGEWHTSGFTQTNLAAGSHTVTFLSVDDWTAPSSQTVTIASNQTMTANGTYLPALGSLQVALSPPGAVSAGARWRVDGGDWRNNGDIVSGLAVGSHTVAFAAVSGWTAPGDKTVQITSGGTTTEIGTYIILPINASTGSLTVTLSPPEVVSVGAKWRVDGGDWFNSGYTQPGLTTGSHTVEFNEVAGFTPPSNQLVTIADGQTTTVGGNYSQVVTIEDADQDGINDEEEDSGPNDGDGNNDGIPDKDQPNVATLQTVDAQMITLETATGVNIRNCRVLESSPTGSDPSGFEFPYGFFDFSLVGLDPGGSVAVTLHLPDGEDFDTYYKFGPTEDNPGDHWYDFTDGGDVGAVIDGNRITLHFIDGQRGDDDLTANGTIVDIGGPGVSTVTTGGGSSNIQNDSDSGGGGGGCFIGTSRR